MTITHELDAKHLSLSYPCTSYDCYICIVQNYRKEGNLKTQLVRDENVHLIQYHVYYNNIYLKIIIFSNNLN